MDDKNFNLPSIRSGVVSTAHTEFHIGGVFPLDSDFGRCRRCGIGALNSPRVFCGKKTTTTNIILRVVLSQCS
jgi:hypothetical protein